MLYRIVFKNFGNDNFKSQELQLFLFIIAVIFLLMNVVFYHISSNILVILILRSSVVSINFLWVLVVLLFESVGPF